MIVRLFLTVLLTLAFLTATARATNEAVVSDSPDAPKRTNAENYKDRMLASCIAMAYKDDPLAYKDASVTASVFIEWTYFDLENSGPDTERLLDQYLGRSYVNPFEGYAGSRFDLLKCIDLYHSKELEAQVKKYVPNPDWIGDKPPAKHKR